MECKACTTKKLPNEFPPDALTDDCKHSVQYCLRCTVKHVRETGGNCPHPGCKQSVEADNERLKFFKALLNEMFKEYSEADGYQTEDVQMDTADMLYITLLTGEYIAVVYNADQLITELKKDIMKETKRETGTQKLLYMDSELKDHYKGKSARLSDFQVKPNSSLCLIFRLFSIPENFDEVEFDLHWGYPSSTVRRASHVTHVPTQVRDYLDATCFLYEGTHCRFMCDYKHRNPISAIHHSGDIMDDKLSIGHHTIKVSLKQIPDNIKYLYFALSAWNSPRIARYPNPSLKFYNAIDSKKNLCKTSFTHASHSQAVIMCSVIRDTSGKWDIFESGKCSGGNAKDYAPLMKTIKKEIKSGH